MNPVSGSRTIQIDPALARDAISHGLVFAHVRLVPGSGAPRELQERMVVERLTRGNASAHEYFRYGVAAQLAGAVAAAHPEVRRVYYFDEDPSADERSPRAWVTTPFGLLLVVDAWASDLQVALDRLDEEITREYRAWLGSRAAGLTSLLRVRIVERHETPAAGADAPPILLWSR